MVPRFDIITESDARGIEPGTTVELARGGHVTPLARDTLRERRVTVVPAGSADPSLPGDLAPRSEIRRVAIASDHTGGTMRAERSEQSDDTGLNELSLCQSMLASW